MYICISKLLLNSTPTRLFTLNLKHPHSFHCFPPSLLPTLLPSHSHSHSLTKLGHYPQPRGIHKRGRELPDSPSHQSWTEGVLGDIRQALVQLWRNSSQTLKLNLSLHFQKLVHRFHGKQTKTGFSPSVKLIEMSCQSWTKLRGASWVVLEWFGSVPHCLVSVVTFDVV